MKLSQAWELYKADKHMQGYSQHTIKAYQLQTRLLIRVIGDMSITDVTHETLKCYIAKDYDRLKPSTIGHRVRYLKSLFTWAYDEGMTKRNTGSRLREPKMGIRIPKTMEKDEVELMKIECQTKRQHALVRMLYATGCRIGELHKLNVSDVDLEERTVVVNGKGDKERTVIFNAECKMSLLSYLNSRKDSCEALFVTEYSPYNRGRAARRASIATLRHTVKEVAKRTNIEKSVYPHRFRHSFASHLFASDAPLSLVQELLGHKKSETTQIYIKTDPERKKKLYDRYK